MRRRLEHSRNRTQVQGLHRPRKSSLAISTHQIRNSKTTSHRQTTHGWSNSSRRKNKVVQLSSSTSPKGQQQQSADKQASISVGTRSIGYPHLDENKFEYSFCIMRDNSASLPDNIRRAILMNEIKGELQRYPQLTATAVTQYNQISQITIEHHREHHFSHECISTSGHWSNLQQRKNLAKAEEQEGYN